MPSLLIQRLWILVKTFDLQLYTALSDRSFLQETLLLGGGGGARGGNQPLLFCFLELLAERKARFKRLTMSFLLE